MILREMSSLYGKIIRRHVFASCGSHSILPIHNYLLIEIIIERKEWGKFKYLKTIVYISDISS